MKKAKKLLVPGSLLLLFFGLCMLVFVFIAWNEIQNKYPSASIDYLRYYHSDELVPIIGFGIFGSLHTLSGLVGFICSRRVFIGRRVPAILCMIFGILALPLGLLLFFGGKASMYAEIETAQKQGDKKRVVVNQRITRSFIGMLVVYFLLTLFMYIINVNNGMIFGLKPFDIPDLKQRYASFLFGGILASNQVAIKIANLSLLMLSPFLLGFVFAIFEGCCPGMVENNKRLKTIVNGITYAISFILYVYLIIQLPSLLKQVQETGNLKFSISITKFASYTVPLFYTIALALLMNITSFASKLILSLICKIRHKSIKSGFNIFGAIITCIVVFIGIPLAESLVKVLLQIAINGFLFIKSVIASLSSILVIFLALSVMLSVLPNRVIQIKFDDGSYYEIEEHGSNGASYGKGTFYDSQGKIHWDNGGNSSDYFSSDEMNKINNYIDKHR